MIGTLYAFFDTGILAWSSTCELGGKLMLALFRDTRVFCNWFESGWTLGSCDTTLEVWHERRERLRTLCALANIRLEEE